MRSRESSDRWFHNGNSLGVFFCLANIYSYTSFQESLTYLFPEKRGIVPHSIGQEFMKCGTNYPTRQFGRV